jgi:hypothetical protein
LLIEQFEDMGVSECLKNDSRARHRWLMPIILATQEAEIRRIKV